MTKKKVPIDYQNEEQYSTKKIKKKHHQKKFKKLKQFSWENDDLSEDLVFFPEPKLFRLQKSQTPLQIFEKMFNVEIINLIIRESNKHSIQKNFKYLNLSSDELKEFIAIFHAYPDIIPSRASGLLRDITRSPK